MKISKLADAKISTTPSSDRQLAAAIGKNAIFGIVASGVQIGTRLVTVPIVIYHLGLGGYGIWSIIMVTAAYMRFGSAGIKSAFQRYVAEATGTGDFETANILVSTGSISIFVLSLMALIPIAIFSRTLARMSGVPQEFLSATARSVTVLAVTYAISNFGAAFEAIVNGGHRIDLSRKYNAVLTICEALAIVTLLHFGYGLLAMTIVMATSELIYILCCFLVSERVVPQMRISLSHFKMSAYPELIRFAGSYQLVNVLEVLYGAVVPIALLKFFGATTAGVVAVAGRLVTSALIAQEALVLPILSGGTMVFASQSAERIKLFLAKAFKMTLAVALPPLAIVCAFGTTMVLAWTGQVDPEFRVAIWLCALASFFRAISLLQLVLYRASGRALLDNIRQVLRIALILIVAAFSRKIGFGGVLAGMAAAEFFGMIFMFFAMSATFHGFSAKILTNDALRILSATAMVIAAGLMVEMVPIPSGKGQRLTALFKLGEIGLACLIVAWPAAVVTKALSRAERRTLLDSIIPRRRVLAVNE